MANYIKATDFAVKDGLLTGDPLKIVSGTEIDAELVAIQTAVNSKANLNSPTFTGTPIAPTASVATDSNQIATTAYVKAVTADLNTTITAAFRALYPVGTIYTNATNNTNPATLLGFGTWAAFGAGRVPVGFNGGDALFDTAEKTGGSKDAVVVSHDHVGSTASSGVHKHELKKGGSVYPSTIGIGGGNRPFTLDAGNDLPFSSANIDEAGAHTHTVTVDSTGESGVNKNVQPYITVYMWKRTA